MLYRLLAGGFYAVVLPLLGVGLITLTANVLAIRSEPVFTALLIFPFIAYLTLSGKLREFTWLGASAKFDALERRIEEIGQYEPERGTYHGKLEQIIQYDRDDFCLIYADIDSLREKTRKIYCQEQKPQILDQATAAKEWSRRTEKEIRRDVIRQLELALSDAAVQRDVLKYEIFSLEEPDIAMIVRRTGAREGELIAHAARSNFSDAMKRQYWEHGDFQRWSATFVVVPVGGSASWKPRNLDFAAGAGLKKAKDRKRGKVYKLNIASGHLEESPP